MHICTCVLINYGHTQSHSYYIHMYVHVNVTLYLLFIAQHVLNAEIVLQLVYYKKILLTCMYVHIINYSIIISTYVYHMFYLYLTKLVLLILPNIVLFYYVYTRNHLELGFSFILCVVFSSKDKKTLIFLCTML